MTRWRYYYHGLHVVSDLHLPEWAPFEEKTSTREPEVTIALGEGPIDSHASAVPEGEFRFRIERAGWFQVRGGRNIVVRLLENANMQLVRIFVLGSAWGALLYQRNALILHGSAVRIDGGAVVFCAPRGAGKSTMAALLGTRGHTLVSDDLCCVSMREGKIPMIYPSIPRVRLWSDAIRELGLETIGLEPDHVRPGKFQCSRQRGALTEPLAIHRIYVLGWGETSIQRLKGFSALERLIHAGKWRGDLLMQTGNPAGHLQQCAELLRQIPVSELLRPKDLSRAPESINFVESEGKLTPLHV